MLLPRMVLRLKVVLVVAPHFDIVTLPRQGPADSSVDRSSLCTPDARGAQVFIIVVFTIVSSSHCTGS